MYWNDGVSSNKVEFLWTDNYVDFHKLDGFSFNTPDKEKGWQEFKVSLSSLIDKPFVSFGIKGIAGESGWEHNQYIDYFRVYDDLDHDLEMIEFDCPANVSFGMEGTFAGYIINRGSKEASGYTIDIYANNEVVASIPGSKVKTNETFVYTTQIKPRYELAPQATFKAVINWPEDQNQKNNASNDYTMFVTVNDFPTVNDLQGQRDEKDDVVLTWSVPAPGTTPQVTLDSFEDHIPFIVEGITPWKLVDIDGENGTFGITYGGKPVEFLNATYPMAYIVFNPAKCGMDQATIGLDALMPHSGNQFLASFQDNDGESDDWLISPELSGDAQTVVFWVRTPIPNKGFETYEVYYSLTGDDIADFIKISGVKGEAFAKWEEVAVSLPVGTKHFAIRHTSVDKMLIGIDDIRYIAKDAPQENLVVNGYIVYRDGEELATVAAPATGYTDNTAGRDAHNYAVTVEYAQGQSGYSNEVRVERTGLESLNARLVAAWGTDGAVKVKGAEGKCVSVASPDGKTVAVVADASDDETIALSTGVYIVTVGNNIFKVLVK